MEGVVLHLIIGMLVFTLLGFFITLLRDKREK